MGLNYKLLELSSGKEIISGEKEGYHLNKSNIKGIEPIVDSELEFEDSKSTYRLDYSKLESSKLDDIKKSIINTLLETELVLEN